MTSGTTNKFSPEVCERAVQLVLDHEGDHSSRWIPCQSIATKMSCSGHTLLEWVKRAEIDANQTASLPTEVAEKMKALASETLPVSDARDSRSERPLLNISQIVANGFNGSRYEWQLFRS